jgi:hypothetical protein
MGYREAFVDKVFKTERFTLRDSKQQWRPHGPGGFEKYWHASQTGDHGYSVRVGLRIWNDAADDEIRAAIATRHRYDRFTTLQSNIERLRFSSLVTDDVINWMSNVVLATKPIPKEPS